MTEKLSEQVREGTYGKGEGGAEKSKRKKKTELRECLLALMEQKFPVTDDAGEPEADERGVPVLRTGAQLQSEALFRRALKDTKSFEVLRSAIGEKEERGSGKGGDDMKNGGISGETEAAVLRAVRAAEEEASGTGTEGGGV